MTKMRKRILGIGCAALFVFSNIAVSMLTAFPAGITLSAAASMASGVKLEAYGGTLAENSVTLQEDGTLPELPIPTREGYDFVGWFTQPIEVNYWGDEPVELDENGKTSWQKLKETYGTSAGYRYLNGRSTDWYDIAETPDPNYADDAGYDWTNSRWIEHSVGLMNATKGEEAKRGTAAADGSTLYAMYDPKNITVYWYNNGWNNVHDAWAVTTGRSFGTEYGSKFAYLPLDKWDPWQDHKFKGWVDENGTVFNFDLDSAYQLTEQFYAPETYSPVLRLYAMYDNVTLPEGNPENAKFDRVIGNGGFFDPNTGTYTFTAVFDSRYKIYPEIKWEIVGGSEYFSLSVSADKTSATISATPELGEAIAKDGVNRRVDVRLTVGGNSYDVYATAAHEWNNGKILSGQWDRCNSPMDVEYKCRNCDQTYIHTYPADGHRYTVYRHEATCTEDATQDRYCVVCGKTEHEILEGTATGHNWDVVKSSGCGGTITTSTCKSCGLVHTEEDHTACHSWNSGYTVDRAATCTTEGSKSIHCKNCDAVKESVTIPATGHSYKETRHNATCTQSGYVEKICSSCGDRVTETISDPTGHDYKVETKTGCNGMTCTVKTCRSCGETETIGDPDALAHVPAQEYVVEKTPTCTETGEKTLRCTVCNVVLERKEIPAVGHSYQIETHEATCTAGAYEVHTCSACGDSFTKHTSAPKGHNFEAVTQTGCGGAQYTTKTCLTCGAVETEGELDALAHTPAAEYVTEKAPSCTEAGEKVLRCTKCDIVLEQKEVPATGHNYQIESHEATCTAGAYEVHTCSACGDSFTKTTSAPKGHNFDVETQTGCSGAQYTTKTCLTCGTVETEGDLAALAHTPATEYVVEKAPTCTVAGEKVLRCTKCDIVLDSAEVSATGHSYQIATHEATCTENGYTVYTCSACQDSYTKQTTAPKGHNFDVKTQTGCNGAQYTAKTCLTCGAVQTEGDLAALAHTPAQEYVIEKAPTCTVAGEKVLRCTKCNVVLEKKEVSATGHNYEKTEHEATCTENGYTVYTCSVCQDSYTKQTSAPKGHNFDVVTQTGCSGAEYTTKTCLTCGAVETEGDLAALAHTPAAEYVTEKAPSCTEAGEKVLRCAKCDIVLDSEEISATGHSYEEIEHEATCTEAGYVERTCTACGDSATEITSEPVGHTAITVTEREATCFEDGLKTVRCASCGCLLESETLPADPSLHAWSEWETKAEGGAIVKSRECGVCGEREETVTQVAPQAQETVTEAAPQAQETVTQAAPQREQTVTETAPQKEQTVTETAPEEAAKSVAHTAPAEAVEETLDSGEQLSAMPASTTGGDAKSAVWLPITLGTIGGTAVLALAAFLILKRRKAGK